LSPLACIARSSRRSVRQASRPCRSVTPAVVTKTLFRRAPMPAPAARMHPRSPIPGRAKRGVRATKSSSERGRHNSPDSPILPTDEWARAGPRRRAPNRGHPRAREAPGRCPLWRTSLSSGSASTGPRPATGVARRRRTLQFRQEKKGYFKGLRVAAESAPMMAGKAPRALRKNRLISPSFSGASRGTDGGTVAQLRRNGNRV
jgi:hypothetical protein